MANSSISAAFMESQCVIQPRRLKDFLQDQKLPFNRPRKSTISVFIHAVRSSSIIRRSISRRFSKSTHQKSISPSGGSPEAKMARSTSVTVKDILRWRSFRDLADLEENNNVHRPSDFTVESPSRCNSTTTTTTTAATTTSAGTPRSSWCDSDFIVGDSPVWCRGFSGEIDVTDKKNFHINVAAAGDRIRQNTRDPKDQIIHEDEDEQFSPISVLDFTQEHEETFSSFHQILAKMDRRNLILKQQIQEFENPIKVEDHSLVNKNIKLDDIESFIIEEKAIELMNHVKTISSIEELNSNMDDLLLDFFRDELFTKNGLETDNEFESRVLQVSKSWITTKSDESLEWEIEGAREMCVGEIEKMINLKDFKDDKQEIGIEIASMVFDYLLDEFISDLVNV